jgi:hypothetical protein
MRAVLIDPEARTVTDVDTDGSLDSIRTAIGCAYIEGHNLRDGSSDILYVDEEALIHHNPTIPYPFRLDYRLWYGKGLVLGVTGDGEPCPPQLTANDIRRRVRFLPR